MKRSLSIRRLLRPLMVVGGVIILGLLAWFVFGQAQQQPGEARATVSGLPSGASEYNTEFARALQPRAFVFPADHGPHPDFQTEWWYYTGNVTDATGRHFGYQLTFFRRALLPLQEVQARESALAPSQIYFAHFAVTDSAADKHASAERFSRGAGGLAGANADPYKVYLENWSAVGLNQTGDAIRLSAQNGAYSITLTLKSIKPIARHGNQGLSAKSDTPGNASYYYSFTRLQTEGSIQTESGAFDVTGQSWMDHEWSTSALGPNAQGWDWYALQLSDQRELMLYRFRNTDGTIDPVSGGTLIQPDGSTRVLRQDQIVIDVLDQWRSPDNGAVYPVKWRVRIPDYSVDLQVEARIKDQQMNVSITYWEGAVKITGQSDNAPVTGVGYVELTGYLDSINGKF